MTITGIDRPNAQSILVELSPGMTGFASHRHFAAWTGLCPSNNENSGKRRSGGGRRGNATLCAVPVESVQAAARTHTTASSVASRRH